jgi:predicted nucleotide-binding protein
MNAGEQWWENHRAENLQTKIRRLEGLIELLQTEVALASTGGVEQPNFEFGHRIFLVHGRDEGVLHEVARFLEKLNLDVIILREQPSSGRTIIEKFVDYSNVGYAIVLLTPDDRGGAAESSLEDQLPRARQNVIVELGYFLGKLGRNRVTALYDVALG